MKKYWKIMNKKTLYVHQRRYDAIWITDKNQINSIKESGQKIFDFLELREKWNTKIKIIYNYFINYLILIKYCFFYKKVYFSYENPYILWLKIIFPFKKYIMCVHHLENWANSYLWKKILQSPCKIITISKFTKNQIVEKWINEEKISVNYNWISKKFYKNKKNTNFSFPYKYILYIGTELERKNIKTLLKCFDILSEDFKDIHFVKIGDAWWKKYQEEIDIFLEKEIKNKDKIHFFRKRIEEEEIKKWYENAKFYISISKLEWFGLTIAEALVCGTPVIASNIEPFREICGDTQILVNPNNKNETIKNMKLLIEHPEIGVNNINNWKKMGKKFDWEENVKNLIKIITKI